MQCPVCKTECGNADECPTCGFNQLNVEFLNREDADEWYRCVVEPYKQLYSSIYYDFIFQTENNVISITGCNSNLENAVIPSNVQRIGEKAFYNCKNLKKVVLPASVKFISDCAFSGCTALNTIVISNSILSIGNMAFEGCFSLKNISLPSSLRFIGDYAFWNCSSLRNIQLPKSLFSIGRYTFLECSAICATYSGTKKEFKGICKGDLNTDVFSSVLCADGAVSMRLSISR